MKLWPFNKRSRSNDQPLPVSAREIHESARIVAFSGDIEHTVTLKYHGLRALCGMLMDRHEACQAAHPFCGPNAHRKNGDTPVMLCAHIIPQRQTSGEDLIGIYLCKAVGGLRETGDIDPLEYTTQLICSEATPFRKMVAQLVSDGTYFIQYGEVLNPVEGDHSTGRLDQDTVTEFRGDPEPAYGKWEYQDIQIGDGPLRTIPEFHCLQVFGEWWVVDVDKEKLMRQKLAALSVANNPYHNFGA